MENTAVEQQITTIVKQLLTEAGITPHALNLCPDTSLEWHLGLDSLSRVELFQRIEKRFGVTLSATTLVETHTLRDIADAVKASRVAYTLSTPPLATAPLPLLQPAISPTSLQTFPEIVCYYQERYPHKEHIHWLDAATEQPQTITYSELYQQALTLAANLNALKLTHGDTIALMLPTHPHFFYAFIGILLAGCTPVPIYPPTRANELEAYVKREAVILKNASVKALITFDQAKTVSHLLRALVPSLRLVLSSATLLQPATNQAPQRIVRATDIALIQYTSGSTHQPKGVVLTHSNLLANIKAYGQAIGLRPDDKMVSWLPLYHDLGLIGAWLGSLYNGTPLILMSPLTFLVNPERWLWAIHHYQATLSAGPNFAYEYCVKKLDDTKLKGLDLSSWRIAINGAEPVLPATLDAFSTRFAPYGFKREALLPVYGLAESSLGLTATRPGQPYKIDTIERNAFESQHQALPTPHYHPHHALQFVSCGPPLPQHEVRIVSPLGHALGERHIGDVQFRGPSAMQGYYRNTDATQAASQQGWWVTGDRGYVAEGELYITGRNKDLIIKAGRNLCPYELEHAAAEIAGIRKGCVIAFGIEDRTQATEKIVIVAEATQPMTTPKEVLISAIQRHLSQTLNIMPDDVVLIPPATLPKTTSGKLKRSACKEAYRTKTLGKKAKPLGLQLLILGLKAMGGYGLASGQWLKKLGFTIYYALILLMTLPCLWLLTWLLPPTPLKRVIRTWIRTLLRLSGCPITLTGKEYLPNATPVIFIANHTSYLDAFILMAILPTETRFIGKKVLFHIPFLRRFLRALDHVAIDKHNTAISLQEVDRMQQTLRAGSPLLIFPEGTFSAKPGLQPFKLGAFKLACQAQVPLYPITIVGMRHILRRDAWLLTPGPIAITISPPLYPTDDTWPAIQQLKSQAYQAILAHNPEGESAG